MDPGTNLDVAGFDNVGTSLLTVFQCTTLGGWSYVLYRVQDNTSAFSIIYFVFLILFGAFFVVSAFIVIGGKAVRTCMKVNLFLAVLKTKFGKAQSLFQSKVQVSPRRRHNMIQKFLAWSTETWKAYARK